MCQSRIETIPGRSRGIACLGRTTANLNCLLPQSETLWPFAPHLWRPVGWSALCLVRWPKASRPRIGLATSKTAQAVQLLAGADLKQRESSIPAVSARQSEELPAPSRATSSNLALIIVFGIGHLLAGSVQQCTEHHHIFFSCLVLANFLGVIAMLAERLGAMSFCPRFPVEEFAIAQRSLIASSTRGQPRAKALRVSSGGMSREVARQRCQARRNEKERWRAPQIYGAPKHLSVCRAIAGCLPRQESCEAKKAVVK